MNKVMQIKNLTCTFNMPPQIKTKNDEVAKGLPPYAPVEAHIVDEYPSCPSGWMNGSAISSSYFLGVKEDCGMWLDFNSCFHSEYDVAIVLSIQGVNPITGQKMIGKECLRLEKYVTKCPIHDVEFQQDRYCPQCKFKWPGQNYISTTATPFGRLWIDGFRAPDGKIRQYVITEDEKKGVAAQIIGDERVFAIGIAYYLSKKKKEKPQKKNSDIGIGGYLSLGSSTPFIGMCRSFSPPKNINKLNRIYDNSKYLAGQFGTDITSSVNTQGLTGGNNAQVNVGNILNNSCQDIGPILNNSDYDPCIDEVVCCDSTELEQMGLCSAEEVVPVKNLEIGAGALISQNIYDDPQEIDFWQDKPTGMIYINYCDQETLKKILASGKRQDEKNGFMQGLKVGSD